MNLRVLEPTAARPADGAQGGFLFVPVSGPGGAGEYVRALALANGVRARWPDAPVHFVLHRGAPYATACPYEVTLIDDSPTRDVVPVMRAIEQLKPAVVIFDSAGRAAQFKAAGSVGALRVYLSSRPNTRWKGFRLNRLAQTDEYWLVGPSFMGTRLSWSERLKLWLFPQVRVRHLATFFDSPSELAQRAVCERFAIERDQYVLCCPGGAGQFAGLASGPAVYGAAATQIAANAKLPVLLVGANMPDPGPGVTLTGALPNLDLMALVAGSRLCVVNGGSLLIQCLALRAACVAAPIAGDQAARIASCVEAGVVRRADFTPESLAATALALLDDEADRLRLRAATTRVGLRNGVEVALDAIDERLSEPTRRAPAFR